jgi:hypothetical protein
MEREGYVWLLRDMLAAETGIQGYHPVEPAVGIDIGEVKTGFGDRSATI